MSKFHPYTYTVLRYVHDTTTGEFVNVGIVLHAPQTRFANALCRPTIGRLRRVFPDLNADHFKSLMRHIQSSIETIGEKLRTELPLQPFDSAIDLASKILPVDDSSLQWSPMGAGRSEDPADTLENLYERFILRHEDRTKRIPRTEADVWRSFKRTLERNQLLRNFSPKRIAVQDDEIEFQHAWKNGVFHCLEPVSFDLSTADSIRNKAHQWLGRITSIADAPEKLRLYFLVGEPQDSNLHEAYQRALGILNKAAIDKEIYSEHQADALAKNLIRKFEEHSSA